MAKNLDFGLRLVFDLVFYYNFVFLTLIILLRPNQKNMKKAKLYSVFAFLFMLTGLQAQNVIEVSYRITVHNCSVFAEGTEDAPIVFTAHDLTNYEDQSYELGWQGFFVVSEPNMNDSLVMDYCTISYAKVTDGTPEDERNGARLHLNNK